MGLFRRKKVEKPKNPLGIAVYKFDNILKGKLGKIVKAMQAGKTLNPSRTKAVLDEYFYKLDYILEDISKENLKIDYRSDKVRYKVIGMVRELKNYLQAAAELEFDYKKIERKQIGSPDSILLKREKLKKDLKDIQSDYV
ncbi:MAG: hypothetical protein ACQEP5_00340 [Actinomycetota bacterium]